MGPGQGRAGQGRGGTGGRDCPKQRGVSCSSEEEDSWDMGGAAHEVRQGHRGPAVMGKAWAGANRLSAGPCCPLHGAGASFYFDVFAHRYITGLGLQLRRGRRGREGSLEQDTDSTAAAHRKAA